MRIGNVYSGGYKEMSSIFAVLIAPSYTNPNGGGGGCGVSANKYSCAQHVTRTQMNFGDLPPYPMRIPYILEHLCGVVL